MNSFNTLLKIYFFSFSYCLLAIHGIWTNEIVCFMYKNLEKESNQELLLRIEQVNKIILEKRVAPLLS